MQGAVLLSPPLRFSVAADLAGWAESGRPLTCLVPEFDDYLQPEEARERFSVIPQAQVIGVDEGKHLWVGERHVTIVINEIVARVAPQFAPLPTDWEGDMERWSDL